MIVEITAPIYKYLDVRTKDPNKITNGIMINISFIMPTYPW